MQSFGGANKVYYRKCANGECKFSPKLFQKSRIAKAAVTLILVSPGFEHPHSQNPSSDMGIPFSYYIPERFGLWLGLGCRGMP